MHETHFTHRERPIRLFFPLLAAALAGCGEAPPHDESGHTWHHPDEVLFAITKFGLVPPYAPANYQSDMPAFAGKLSDQEIRSVLAWIATHWKSRGVLEARAEMLRNARR